MVAGKHQQLLTREMLDTVTLLTWMHTLCSTTFTFPERQKAGSSPWERASLFLPVHQLIHLTLLLFGKLIFKFAPLFHVPMTQWG